MKNKWIAGVIIGTFLVFIGLLGLFLRPGEFPVNRDDGNEDVVDTDTDRKLPVPALLEDKNPNDGISEFEISVQEGETEFISGLKTPTLGYNGSYLGPVIRVSRGDEVRMHIKNELSDETSVHWHGLEVEGTDDGGPHQVIAENGVWEPVFEISQPAATLWFHPHVIGTTAIQVYYGLAGLLIVEDENSKSLNLPDEYGVNDIPLIIQDRSFSEDGSFLYYDNMMDGAYGEHIMVNGAITPYLDVDQVKMRFRVVNGANASNFDLRLSDRSEFQQIASDGGLLESPVERDSLFITPGERAEIIVDFSKYEDGDVLELESDGERVMSFRVGEEAEDTTEIPLELAEIEKMDQDLVTGFKSIELDGMGRMVTLNGRQFDMDRIDDDVAEGELEIWEITTNRSMMMGSLGHPFHIHGTQFQVLSRNGEEPYQNEMGWKDTIFVNAGETVRIIVRFRFKGVFMYHCHILEHEEAGMMGQLEVY
ncbi:multicopper oxidase family protein [Proteiniclasticum sp. C24MP]|uniref:multicopper oxidase family protein n=1 Tax=Proteiniclasticum sp. C24MP TaxID=3374101 RepID=UPI00375454B0